MPRARVRRLVAVACIAGVAGAWAFTQYSSRLEPATLAFEAPVDDETPVNTLPSDASQAAEAIAADVPHEGDCSSDDAFCVGVVTGLGRVDDSSLNELVWSTLTDYEAEAAGDGPHMQVDLVETARSNDLDTNVDLLVAQQYDLIITVGSDAAAVTLDAATASPELSFLGVEQPHDATIANYSGITGSEVEAGAAAVALAAEASSSGVVGLILPTTNNPAHDLLLEGATTAATTAGVTLIVEHEPTTGSGPAATWAPEQVDRMIEADVDVVAVLGVTDARGALEVVGSYPDLLCIGHGADRWDRLDLGKSCLLTSIELDVSEPLIDIVSARRSGERLTDASDAALTFSPQRALIGADGTERAAPDVTGAMASILPDR